MLSSSVFSPQPNLTPSKNGTQPVFPQNHYQSTIADKIKLLLAKSALNLQASYKWSESSLSGAANLMVGKHSNPMTTTLGNISSLQKHISSQHQLFNLLKDLNA